MSPHSQVIDLLPGYALGAASAAEAESIRAHLPECGECRADLARLGEAASVLALAVEEVAPPARLRQRIRAAVRGEELSLAEPSEPFRTVHLAGRDERERAVREPIERARPARRFELMSRLRSPWMPAAAAAVIIAGLLAWNLRLQAELGSRPVAVGGAGVVTAPLKGAHGGDFGAVTVLRQQKLALVGLRNLARPLPGRAFELWVIHRRGKPRPAGVFLPDGDGTKLLVVAQDVHGDTLAVTDEPLAGSLLPTTSPFITGSA